jgi:uncharacterized protein
MAIEATITLRSRAARFVSNPIRPEWILQGAPVARIELLSSSADGTASTYLWDCTGGRFNWFYSFDETFHILEGAVTLKGPSGNARDVAAGDTVFFPAGSSAEWTVHEYVRKLAFCRSPLPWYLAHARRTVQRLRRAVRGGSDADGGAGLL